MVDFAESNRAQLLYIAESVWGTTPGSGTVKTMRLTKSGIVASKDTKQSDELRADRMVSNIIEVGAATKGSIDTEFSAGSQDDFWSQFLGSTWSKAMNFFIVKGTSINITGANTITVTGDWTDWVADNQWLKLEGFLDVDNNTYVSVAGTPGFAGGVTTITVDQTLVAESGSAFTKIMDAGDLVAYATTITFTSGNTVDGGGANAFGGLQVGQKVWLEGLGKETGTITAGATDPAEGDTFVISDGVDSITFEIRTDGTAVAAGNVHVALSGTPATLAASIAAAIMGQFRQQNFRCSATTDGVDTVTVTNHRRTGGSITETGGGLSRVDFTGGSATKGGFYTVASLVDNDTFTTTETLTADANAGTLKVLVKGSHVRNPGDPDDIVKSSMSIETGFTDVSKYLLHDGLRVGGFDFDVSAGDIVKLNFELAGSETTPYDETQLGDTVAYTVLDTTATEVLNATSNVGSVYKDGAAFTTAVMSIKMKGDAKLRDQKGVGSKFPVGIGLGRFTLTGSVEAYFGDLDNYRDFLNHTTVSMAFDFEDADHNAYWFTMPAVKFLNDPVAPGGIDQDVMETIEFSAQRDATLETMFMVDRFSSTFPPTA
jgi:hypothetical protein